MVVLDQAGCSSLRFLIAVVAGVCASFQRLWVW